MFFVVQWVGGFDWEIEDDRFVAGFILKVYTGSVYKLSFTVSCDTISFVDMSENMVEWIDSVLNLVK